MAWRGIVAEWGEFLPEICRERPVTLMEGDTPLIPAVELSRRLGIAVFLKFEGLNPTGSFKDRGMAAAMSAALAQGSEICMCASTGNTAASAAAYAARAGLACFVVVPRGKVAVGKLAGAMVAGASVIEIDGNLTGEPLDVLINNAGVAGHRGLTGDGFELTFGVNHLGHFALTMALLDRLAQSAPARVVCVSSDAHYQAKGIDFTALRRRTRGITGLQAYAVSKLCNVLFAQELARRAEDRGITTYALHPGVVASDIWRRVPWPVRSVMTARMLTTEQGAATSLYCATSPEVAKQTGRFYDNCREREPSAVATEQLGKILWERSEAWTGV